jgi:hypothetical protein
LVALCRRRWGLVAIMVILAALVKPQFVVLAVVLFAARQWRWSGIAMAGVVLSNLAAYALWPEGFPQSITQTMHNIINYGSGAMSVSDQNVSFGKGLLAGIDGIKASRSGGKIPYDFFAGPRSLIGYVVLVLVVVSVVALGRRIPPVMVGIALLATSSLFPTVSNRYYLVFVLPIAALVVRHPDGAPGTGVFDRPATVGGRRRAVGVCVSLVAAISIAQIALPSPAVQVTIFGPAGEFWTVLRLVGTTALCAPILWLVTCAAIIVSYARRPVQEALPETGVGTSSTSESMKELSPERPADLPNAVRPKDLGYQARSAYLSDDVVAEFGERQQV